MILDMVLITIKYLYLPFYVDENLKSLLLTLSYNNQCKQTR